MSEVKVPNLTQELIDALAELFPEQAADLNWTDREVWYHSGQCSVVRFLQSQMDIQNETILQNPQET